MNINYIARIILHLYIYIHATYMYIYIYVRCIITYFHMCVQMHLIANITKINDCYSNHYQIPTYITGITIHTHTHTHTHE